MGLLRILIRLFSGGRSRSPRRKYRETIVVARPLPPTYSKSPYAASHFPSPPLSDPPVTQTTLIGQCWVVDGDTIIINDIRIRLAGIDAPELDHPFGKQSKWALVKLCKGQIVTAHIKPELSYDRVVADCFLPDGRDLSAELVRCGMALDWPKYEH